MVNFAQLDINNKVLQVIVVSDADAPDEATGIQFCKDLLGQDTEWKLASSEAGIGTIYYADKDKFIPPQPFPSWRLGADDSWEPPVPVPDDIGFHADILKFIRYDWDEDSQTWGNKREYWI
jgi:hypothetical protein